MRRGMLYYVAGLVLLTGAVELVIASIVATGGALPSSSAPLWPVYAGSVLGLLILGGVLVPRGLLALRARPPAAEPPA